MKLSWLQIGISAATLFVIAGIGAKVMNKPRGIRNNNPGNIKLGSSNWVGKIPNNQNTDGTFEQFKEMKFGIRAMLKVLSNYIDAGHDTIEKIIKRYAPASENNTNAYIESIEAKTGLKHNERLYANRETLYKLSSAMAYHENGQQPITNDLFNQAYNIL